MDKKVYIIDSPCTDVYENLAYETALLDYANQQGEQGKSFSALFLWQNDNTIVIGRHQNPYKECNLSLVQSNTIKLARRASGGGAVYHDKGNVNFSFVMSSDSYNQENNFLILLQAMQLIGIKAELSGRNDVLVDGKKFSGNAFINKKYAYLHHGTILIQSDLSRIEEVLTPNRYKLVSKGVDSVKSRVINLKSISNNIDSLSVKNALMKVFKEKCRNISYKLPLNTKELFDKYSSNEWIYGEYFEKGLVISRAFSWGLIDLCILPQNNRIGRISLASDALAVEEVENFMSSCNELELNEKIITQRLKSQTQIAADLKLLLLELVVNMQ